MNRSIVLCLIGIVVGGAVSHFMFPRIKKEVTYREVKRVDRDIRTIIIRTPDGRTITKIIDKSKEVRKIHAKSIETPVGSTWSVGLQMGVYGEEGYRLTIGRRILGNLHAVASGTPQGEVSLGLRYEF